MRGHNNFIHCYGFLSVEIHQGSDIGNSAFLTRLAEDNQEIGKDIEELLTAAGALARSQAASSPSLNSGAGGSSNVTYAQRHSFPSPVFTADKLLSILRGYVSLDVFGFIELLTSYEAAMAALSKL